MLSSTTQKTLPFCKGLSLLSVSKAALSNSNGWVCWILQCQVICQDSVLATHMGKTFNQLKEMKLFEVNYNVGKKKKVLN